jgi:chromosomal replication initiator protein
MLRSDSHFRADELDGLLPSDTSDDGLSALWLRIRERLRAELGEAVYMSWFGRIEPECFKGSVAEFSVPTKFLKTWVQQHYVGKLLTYIQGERPDIDRVSIVVRATGVQPVRGISRPELTKPVAIEARVLAGAQPASAGTSPARGIDGVESSPLDRRMTFDSFLQSRSNALAVAAAQQVGRAAPSDAPIYNPLYIHASVGLGKTHLAQATAQAVEAAGKRVMYLTAERFMYGFVAALKAQTAIAFKEKLRCIDLLVIDDVQFLHGKSMQQEFCHTLNALIDSGRQVIIAGDRPPSDLEGLEERVRSRLAGGLVVEIGSLDEELRKRILEMRVTQARSNFPELVVPDAVIGHIARLVTANGRDLEGAVNRLLAHATLTGQPHTLESAENAVRDLIRTREIKKVKIEDIQRLVANHYSVSRQDILSSRRTATVVRPRQIAMYLSKALTPRSYPEIGRRFGGRDHTTVLHAVRKIEELCTKDNVLAGEIDLLKRMLQE